MYRCNLRAEMDSCLIIYFLQGVLVKIDFIDIQKNRICLEVVGHCAFDLKQLKSHKTRLKMFFFVHLWHTVQRPAIITNW